MTCGNKLCRDHGKRKDRCKECQGAAEPVCEHGNAMYTCIIGWRDGMQCGSQLCQQHGRRKDRCNECEGVRQVVLNRVVTVRNAATQTEAEETANADDCSACAGKHRRHTCGRRLWKRKRPVVGAEASGECAVVGIGKGA